MSVSLDVGANIRAIRNARGQTVEEFAEDNGWKKQQVSRWEQGRCDMRLSNLDLIALALRVRLSDLTMGVGGKEKRPNGPASEAVPFDHCAKRGTIPDWFLKNIREDMASVNV